MESIRKMTLEEMKKRYGSEITYALLQTIMMWEHISHGELEIVEKDKMFEINIRIMKEVKSG